MVVGEEVGGTGHDDMVLGDTPNIAARLQGVAAPNTLVIGALTHHLVGGFFDVSVVRHPALKGVAAPLEVYQVLYESTARTRLEALGGTGLTPLVGRDRRAAAAREALGVRSSMAMGRSWSSHGEAGIGKSRLVHALTEHAAEQQAWFTHCQCSPYHQHTAFYPLIDLFERVVLRFERQESPAEKLTKLEGFFVQSGLPLEDACLIFSSLLSIPLGAELRFPDLPPDQQKQQTMRALHDHPPSAEQRSSRCCSSSRICTGSIRPRWSS